MYLHPPEALAIFLNNGLRCNGTCSVTGDARGAQTEKMQFFQSLEPEFNSRDLYMKSARASFYCKISTVPDSAEPNFQIDRAT